MTAASLTYSVKDEDLPQVIADLAAPSLDPDVLRRHAKKFYSEVDLFCTHVGEAYPKRRRRSTRRKRVSTRRRSSLLAPVGAPAPAAAPAAAQRAKTPRGQCGQRCALYNVISRSSSAIAGVICYGARTGLRSLGGETPRVAVSSAAGACDDSLQRCAGNSCLLVSQTASKQRNYCCQCLPFVTGHTATQLTK